MSEERRGTVSIFNGPDSIIRTFRTPEAEMAGVAEWIKSLVDDGVQAAEIGIFVRSKEQLARARQAVKDA